MMDLFSLQGKRALVTGASRGLGRAMAESLAAAGADVVCSSSRKSGTYETAAAVKALGREVWQIAADLSSTEGAHRPSPHARSASTSCGSPRPTRLGGPRTSSADRKSACRERVRREAVGGGGEGRRTDGGEV